MVTLAKLGWCLMHRRQLVLVCLLMMHFTRAPSCNKNYFRFFSDFGVIIMYLCLTLLKCIDKSWCRKLTRIFN
uniref:Putative secreted protein n=1 Tax=Xenopsylla cheopis TaxID=163159 RepID=A0A6M2E284_XENCH